MNRKTKLCSAVAVLIAVLTLESLAVADDKHPTIDLNDGWKKLFSGSDLAGWKTAGKWAVEDGVLALKGRGGDIWTTDVYGDFVLDLEFKISKGGNSGVAVRISPDPDASKKIGKRWHTDGALEIQILDSHGQKPDMHNCGSMYDLIAPTKNMAKPAGQWHRYTVTAKGNKVAVVLNGEQVIDMDLNDWPTVHKNPDGSRNKYNKPMKDFPRSGHILLQDHGNPVWFRNIYIKSQ